MGRSDIRRRLVHLAAAAAMLTLASLIPLVLTTHSASPQARTIKLINPFPPGGTADVIARIVTEQIGRVRGATFVIENRPGAGTVIGTEAVARAAPDGNTLLINSTSFVINPHIRQLSFDPLASFAPICNLTQSPQLLFVNNDSPYRTMGEMIAAARVKPGELTLASTPAGSAQI
jgi:tripartite-type tricarboxylate transporter receptor subunit TctC